MIAAQIYSFFPVEVLEVLERLDEINPNQGSGRRKNKQHQYSDKDLLMLLKNHITKVIILMEVAKTKTDFLKSMKQIKKIKLN